MWRNGRKKKVDFCDILSFIKEASTHGCKVIVGTDSQPYREGTQFVTAIAVISVSKEHNCRYFYLKHPPKDTHNLYSRIFEEAQLSIETALAISDSTSRCDLEIHLDISPSDSRHRTSQYSSSLTSLVRGYGFQEVKIKPDSWCASSIADAHSKC